MSLRSRIQKISASRPIIEKLKNMRKNLTQKIFSDHITTTVRGIFKPDSTNLDTGLFAALVIFAANLWFLSFVGYDLTEGFYVIRNIIAVLSNGFFIGLSLLFLTFISILIKKGEYFRWEEIFLVILLTFITFLTFTLRGNILLVIGALARIILIFYIYSTYVRESSDRQGKINILIVLTIFDFFLVPFLNDILKPFRVNIRMFPFWYFALQFMFPEYKKSKAVSIINLLLLLLYFFMFFIYTVPHFYGGYIKGDKNLKNDFYNNLKVALNNLKKTINESKKRLINATDMDEIFYTGDVDPNARRDLGVEITKIERSQEDFYYDQPLELWATIKINSIGKKQINLTNFCYAKDESTLEKIFSDKVYPKNISVYEYDKESINCVFDKFRLKKKAYTIVIGSRFNFETKAYQKVYFIEHKKATSLKMRGIDIYDYYKIKEDPKTIYTKGPVMIGMNTEDDLIKISPNNTRYFTLGITIANDNDGKILNITSFKLYMPKGITFKGRCGSYKFNCIDYDNSNMECTLINKIRNIKDYKNLRCFMSVKPSDFNQVMRGSPLSIRFFKVDIEYNYELKKKENIYVDESDYIKYLKKMTVKSKPHIKINNLCIKPNHYVSVPMDKIANDSETPYKYLNLEFKVFNTEIAECKLNGSKLKCKGLKEGKTRMNLKVSDLHYKVNKVIDVYISSSCQQAINTELSTIKLARLICSNTNCYIQNITEVNGRDFESIWALSSDNKLIKYLKDDLNNIDNDVFVYCSSDECKISDINNEFSLDKLSKLKKEFKDFKDVYYFSSKNNNILITWLIKSKFPLEYKKLNTKPNNYSIVFDTTLKLYPDKLQIYSNSEGVDILLKKKMNTPSKYFIISQYNPNILIVRNKYVHKLGILYKGSDFAIFLMPSMANNFIYSWKRLDSTNFTVDRTNEYFNITVIDNKHHINFILQENKIKKYSSKKERL